MIVKNLKPTSKSIMCEYIRIVLRFTKDSKLKPTINYIICEYITSEERFTKKTYKVFRNLIDSPL